MKMTIHIVVTDYVLWDVIHSVVDHIGGVMVSVIASSKVDRGFELRLGKTKDYTIGNYYFSAKHPALRTKSKDRLARNQNNVFECSDKSPVD